MSSVCYGGSIRMKSDVDYEPWDGKYPVTAPEVFLAGKGQYNHDRSCWNWYDDSVVVLRNKHVLKYTTSISSKKSIEHDEKWRKPSIDIDSSNDEKEANSLRTCGFTVAEYDLENLQVRRYNVTLDAINSFCVDDYYDLSCFVDVSDLGNRYDVRDGILYEYIGMDDDIIIPDGVVAMAPHSLGMRDEYRSITIPKTLVYIPKEVSKNCRVQFIHVDENNPKYYTKDGLLIDRETKTLVWAYAGNIIPSDGSVKTIGANAFCCHSAIREITIPDAVTTIDSDAFRHCYNLEEVKIPDAFVGDAQRIFGASLVKEGDKYRLEVGENAEYRGFSF